MPKQKLLTLVTLSNHVRAKIDSLDAEDGELVKMNKEVGLSGCPHVPFYPTVLHAIGDGWRLMAPPQFIAEYVKNTPAWEWWLEK